MESVQVLSNLCEFTSVHFLCTMRGWRSSVLEVSLTLRCGPQLGSLPETCLYAYDVISDVGTIMKNEFRHSVPYQRLDPFILWDRTLGARLRKMHPMPCGTYFPFEANITVRGSSWYRQRSDLMRSNEIVHMWPPTERILRQTYALQLPKCKSLVAVAF